MVKNIFLDFLNRDSRELYGLTQVSERKHVSWLVEAINVAIFLCDEFCLIPPGFVAECPLARRALTSQTIYFSEGLIRTSMREDSFDEYFDKKEEEYRTQAERYSGLFDGKSREYFRKNRLITVPRERVIGDQIVTEWEHGPDRPGFMKEIVDTIGLGAKKIDSIRKIPSELRMEGMAVTWAAIETEMLRLQLPPNSKALRHVVQHLYFSQYLDELGLCRRRGTSGDSARGSHSGPNGIEGGIDDGSCEVGANGISFRRSRKGRIHRLSSLRNRSRATVSRRPATLP